MGFFRQEYWSELPFLPPGDLPDPGIELAFLESSAGRWMICHLGKILSHVLCSLGMSVTMVHTGPTLTDWQSESKNKQCRGREPERGD